MPGRHRPVSVFPRTPQFPHKHKELLQLSCCYKPRVGRRLVLYCPQKNPKQPSASVRPSTGSTDCWYTCPLATPFNDQATWWVCCCLSDGIKCTIRYVGSKKKALVLHQGSQPSPKDTVGSLPKAPVKSISLNYLWMSKGPSPNPEYRVLFVWLL